MDEPSKPSVLWIDDDVGTFRSYAGELSANGFNVSVASSISEAVSKLKEQAYDLIATDFFLSQGMAFELIEEARKLSNAKIVIFSANAHSHDTQHAMPQQGVWVLARKHPPLDPDEIKRDVADPLRAILAGHADPGQTESDDTKWPQVRLILGEEVLVADFDTGLETSFVSFELLQRNNLIKAKVSNQMVVETIRGSRITGIRVSVPCIWMDGTASTRSIVLNCFAVRDWAESPLNRPRSRPAIVGRNILYDNNITARIDPSGELFFEEPITVQDISPEPLPEAFTPPRRRDAVASEAAKRQNHIRLNGARLSSLRSSKALVVRELAAKARISESTLRAAENGRWIKFETAGKIATALDTHFSNLVADLETGDRNTSALPPPKQFRMPNLGQSNSLAARMAPLMLRRSLLRASTFAAMPDKLRIMPKYASRRTN